MGTHHVQKIIRRGLVNVPDGVMRESNNAKLHLLGHLSKALRLGMFLERKGGEVDAGAEDLGFGEDGDSADAIELHLGVGVAVGIAEVGQVRTPGGVLGVAFDYDSVLVEGCGELEGGFGFLPGVEIVGLFTAEPVRERTPDVC